MLKKNYENKKQGSTSTQTISYKKAPAVEKMVKLMAHRHVTILSSLLNLKGMLKLYKNLTRHTICEFILLFLF